MKKLKKYDSFMNEKKLTYTEKEQMVKDYYSKIEILSGQIFEFVKDNGFDIFNDDDFKSDLQKVIQNNVDFHLPE